MTKRSYVKRLWLAMVLSLMFGVFSFGLSKYYGGALEYLVLVMIFLIVPGMITGMFLPFRNYLKIATASALSCIAVYWGAFLPIYIDGDSKTKGGCKAMFPIVLLLYLLFFVILTFIYRIVMDRRRQNRPI